MKYSILLRHLFFWMFCAVACVTCSPSSRVLKSKQYEVLLAPQVQDNHLTTTYRKFQWTDCKRLSRSENRWQFTYTDRERGHRKLQKVLQADTLIRTIALVDTLAAPPSNSTNQGYQKSQPIKNQ